MRRPPTLRYDREVQKGLIEGNPNTKLHLPVQKMRQLQNSCTTTRTKCSEMSIGSTYLRNIVSRHAFGVAFGVGGELNGIRTTFFLTIIYWFEFKYTTRRLSGSNMLKRGMTRITIYHLYGDTAMPFALTLYAPVQKPARCALYAVFPCVLWLIVRSFTSRSQH